MLTREPHHESRTIERTPLKELYSKRDRALVADTFLAYLGEAWFPCRTVSQAWAKQGPLRLSRDAIRVKPGAYLEKTTALSIASCIASGDTKAVFLPMRGGSIQRRWALEMARHIQDAVRRPLLFVLEGFFGFLDMYMYMYHIRTKYLRRGRTLGRGWEDIGRKLGEQQPTDKTPGRYQSCTRSCLV